MVTQGRADATTYPVDAASFAKRSTYVSTCSAMVNLSANWTGFQLVSTVTASRVGAGSPAAAAPSWALGGPLALLPQLVHHLRASGQLQGGGGLQAIEGNDDLLGRGGGRQGEKSALGLSLPAGRPCLGRGIRNVQPCVMDRWSPRDSGGASRTAAGRERRDRPSRGATALPVAWLSRHPVRSAHRNRTRSGRPHLRRGCAG